AYQAGAQKRRCRRAAGIACRAVVGPSGQFVSLMWLAWITCAHLSICACMNEVNCGWDIVTGVAPSFSQAAFISGRETILVISRLSRSTIGLGVPAGAMKPTQSVAWKPGTPASAMVGTSGRMGERAVPVVPSARTMPPLIIGAMVG